MIQGTKSSWGAIAVLYAVWFVVCGILFFTSYASTWNWGLFLFSLGFFVYTPLSFTTIQPDEIAAMLLFDRPIANLHSGLAFTPLGIFSVRRFKKTQDSIEVPADSRKIWGGDEDKTLGV